LTLSEWLESLPCIEITTGPATSPDLFANDSTTESDDDEDPEIQAKADAFWNELRELIAIGRNAAFAGERNSAVAVLDKALRMLDTPE
jgi:hypothetical protein